MADGRSIAVSLYGTTIGVLVAGADGARLTWSPDAESRWGLNSRVLSRHLRVGTATVADTESFFGALLPEGNLLERLAVDAKTTSRDLVGIFSVVGADLAGALRIGEASDARQPQRLAESEIAELLRAAPGYLVGGGGSALPGFQPKLTLTLKDDGWYRGNGSMPSTHILKPVDPDLRAVVDAEAYALLLARSAGLAQYDSWVEDIGDRPTLVIARYDRDLRRGLNDGGIGDVSLDRVHQEDAGQALGLPWGGNDKFEQQNPLASLRSIAGLLDTRGSALRGTPDRLTLLKYVAFNVAIGNTDAHAKNFSLIHFDDGRTRLAPLYDVAPLALGHANGTTMAMRVNGKYQLPDVSVVDLVAEGISWGLAEAQAHRAVTVTLETIAESAHELGAPATIEAHVPGYIRAQARNLLDGKPARVESAIPLMALPRLGTPRPG